MFWDLRLAMAVVLLVLAVLFLVCLVPSLPLPCPRQGCLERPNWVGITTGQSVDPYQLLTVEPVYLLSELQWLIRKAAIPSASGAL